MRLKSYFIQIFLLLLMIELITTACTPQASSSEPVNGAEEKLRVVATTSIIGDVIRQVGGDLIDLEVLLPVGTDPHSFEPTPQDAAKLTQAEVLFINGAGLEIFLAPLIESSGGDFRFVDLSQEIPLISLAADIASIGGLPEGGFDPHVWMDPNNVILWARKISSVLSELDEESISIYEANVKTYIWELKNLDAWIRNKIEEIPPVQRKLITDHFFLGYFAHAYGFEQVGAAIPAFSTQSQPSAQELSVLEDIIKNEHVKAIFVSESVNPNLTRRIAEDTDIQFISVYIGSLTDESGPANNYINLIRYDVDSIVNALR